MLTNLLLGAVLVLLVVFGSVHAWAALEEALTQRAIRDYVRAALGYAKEVR